MKHVYTLYQLIRELSKIRTQERSHSGQEIDSFVEMRPQLNIEPTLSRLPRTSQSQKRRKLSVRKVILSALCFTIGLAAPLITLKNESAYADYQRTYDYQLTSNPYKVSDWIDTDGAISCTVNSYQGTQHYNNFTYGVDGVNSFSRNYQIGVPFDVSTFSSIRLRLAYVRSGSVVSSDATSVNVTFTYPGSDPDQGVNATEQRYNNQTFYSADFTKSNSLPLIYTGSLFLSDFTPNGNCNSIQVDASTVGGDQLEWRLNLGQSGIDGQSAWLPIGFKLPIQIGAFDEHSIQLRMEDPDNPGQYYDLQSSELSMCTVSYGYTVDVYLGIPPGEYQELPTQEMPTVNNYELPTMPDISGYVTTPVGIVSMIFTWLTSLPHIAILIGVLAFAYVIKVIIW